MSWIVMKLHNVSLNCHETSQYFIELSWNFTIFHNITQYFHMQNNFVWFQWFFRTLGLIDRSQSKNSKFLQHWLTEYNRFLGTCRNWHKRWYFTSPSRGIGIQFSTSNNTTSLYDHWLVYRHCAKLRHWGKVERVHLPYK